MRRRNQKRQRPIPTRDAGAGDVDGKIPDCLGFSVIPHDNKTTRGVAAHTRRRCRHSSAVLLSWRMTQTEAVGNLAIYVTCRLDAVAGLISVIARFVGVEGYGPAVGFQISLHQTQVSLGGIVRHKPRRELAGGIVDHVNQIESLAAVFQPVVVRCVPLQQLAARAPPLPPDVRLRPSSCGALRGRS